MEASLFQQSAANFRRVNFTHNEKLLLISLVEKNKCWIVENQYSLDGFSNWRKKSEVWKEISRDFNMLSKTPIQRDVRQLRKCWENLKTRYRKLNRTCQSSSGDAPSNESDIVSSTEIDDTSSENSLLFQRVGALVSVLNQQRMVTNSNMNYNPTSAMSIENNNQRICEGNTFDISSGSGISNRSNEDHIVQPRAISEDDVSIVNVTSVRRLQGSDAPPTKSSASFSDSMSANGVVEICFEKTENETMKQPPKKLVKQKLIGNTVFKNSFKSGVGAQRARMSPFARSHLIAQGRQQPVDTEKLLRIRYIRSRIREQELRIRMIQQKMSFERERHEATMTLLHKQSAFYQSQVDRVHDQFNDDTDFCDDWFMNVN